MSGIWRPWDILVYNSKHTLPWIKLFQETYNKTETCYISWLIMHHSHLVKVRIKLRRRTVHSTINMSRILNTYQASAHSLKGFGQLWYNGWISKPMANHAVSLYTVSRRRRRAPPINGCFILPDLAWNKLQNSQQQVHGSSGSRVKDQRQISRKKHQPNYS